MTLIGFQAATMAMTSSVPYLLRAINEWIIDNGYTPYLILDAAVGDTSVPMEYVKDGQIVLNISGKLQITQKV